MYFQCLELDTGLLLGELLASLRPLSRLKQLHIQGPHICTDGELLNSALAAMDMRRAHPTGDGAMLDSRGDHQLSRFAAGCVS